MSCMAPQHLCVELYHQGLSGRRCAPVEDAAAAEIRELAEGLSQLCLEHGATGLAAPQVGVFLRLAVLRLPEGEFETLINPRVVNLGERDLLEAESCPALPGASVRIWRSEMVQVRSDPDSGRVRTYKGALARAVQHEMDHLDGAFYLDRCQRPARMAALREYTQWLKKRQGLGARVWLQNPGFSQTPDPRPHNNLKAAKSAPEAQVT